MTTYTIDVLLTNGDHTSFDLIFDGDAGSLTGLLQQFLDGKLKGLGPLALNRDNVAIAQVVSAKPLPPKEG